MPAIPGATSSSQLRRPAGGAQPVPTRSAATPMRSTAGRRSPTAGLGPAKLMKHALILGVVGTLLGAAGAAATWGKGMGPAWYPVSLAVLALPQCWVGGKLYERRAASRV